MRDGNAPYAVFARGGYDGGRPAPGGPDGRARGRLPAPFRLGFHIDIGSAFSAAPECQDRAGAGKLTAGLRGAGTGAHAVPPPTGRSSDPTGLLRGFPAPCARTSGARGGSGDGSTARSIHSSLSP